MEGFQIKVDDFRKEFRDADMFLFATGPDRAYVQMDATYEAIVQLEGEAAEIQSKEEMLEITRHDYKQIPDCRTDLVLLKGVWDVTDMILSQLNEWKKTQWNDIDTAVIDD
jgi:dynein heavy chain